MLNLYDYDTVIITKFSKKEIQERLSANVFLYYQKNKYKTPKSFFGDVNENNFSIGTRYTYIPRLPTVRIMIDGLIHDRGKRREVELKFSLNIAGFFYMIFIPLGYIAGISKLISGFLRKTISTNSLVIISILFTVSIALIYTGLLWYRNHLMGNSLQKMKVILLDKENIVE